MEKFVAIKAVLNLGLSEKLQVAFPNIVPVEKPLVINKKIGLKIRVPSGDLDHLPPPRGGDPHWLVGFTTAEAGLLFL